MKSTRQPAFGPADITAARRRIATGLRLTPCAISAAMSERAGTRVWLKREDLQHTGSFKERGARHALSTLSTRERRAGVVAASAGNHALGLAYHGAQLGVPVTVVVPTSAPEVKRRRCQALGANVIVRGASFDESQRYAAALAGDTGATVVHPFDDVRVIAGQGTVALEMLEQAPEVDTLVVPVGGGGLLAGVVAAVKHTRPKVRVVAVEPANAAGFLAAALCGGPTSAALAPTVADGLAVSRVGEHTFRLAIGLVDDVVTVTEHEIGVAIAVLARQEGIVAEGAGATALAAVLAGKVSSHAVAVPITGRNIDRRRHEQVVAHHPGASRCAWAYAA